MDGAWLARVRWRRRGAWLWPAFAALTVVDALIGHLLPPAGESQSFGSGLLVALFLNLVAVVLLSRGLSLLLRRARKDLPVIIARDYAGRGVICAVTVALLAAGLVHRSTIVANRRAMRDAIVRAQAFIGDRAPAEFRRHLAFVSTFPIEPGRVYRVCVLSPRGRTYCVIVNMAMPFGSSVKADGYEPNAVFSEGAG